MKRFLPYISYAALAVFLGSAIAYFIEAAEKASVHKWMLACTIVWFVTAPFWIGREKAGADPDELS